MNFEKIELIGFKSFADKMEITFDNGVTAIVGPNGCGKSNISDAVRWVLGEQSAKSLRGSSMTDVIFNGTQNRKSLSYCEVSLYFDNSNHIFKSCDYQEVILTRKLFRSGESEYYINKQPARMRDIIDLLHECGVSKNGYTIISQGKVSEILSSKPEDRRAIFEEAVGISKSKSVKSESERKLERTRENILRINDIITEISRQLEPAERSAEKTKKYLELSDELKYHEVNNFLYKHENASTQKDNILLRIQGLSEEYAVNEQQLASAEADYENHMKELSESDSVLNSLHEEILQRSISQEKLESDTRIYREKIGYLKNEIERLDTEERDRKEKIELLNKAIVAKKEALASAAAEKSELSEENDKLTKKLNKLFEQIAQGETLSKSSQSEILVATETIADINKNIGALGGEKTVISSRMQEVSESVKILSDEIAALSLSLKKANEDLTSNQKTKEDAEKNIEELEKSISAHNEKIAELTNEIYKLNIDINNLSSRQKIFANIKETFEGFPSSVRRLMSDAKTNATLKSHIKDVVAQVVKTDKKYETAVETAIGNAIQHVITDTPEDAQYVIEYLKKAEAGRATMLPIASLKPRPDCAEILSALHERGVLGKATDLVKYDIYYKRVIEYLLGNTLIVDTSASALAISKKYDFTFKVVTLDGDVFNPSGTIAGGSRRQNTTSFISTDRVIEQLSAEVEEKRKKLEEFVNEKSILTQKANEEVAALDVFNNLLIQSKQNISTLNVQIDSLNSVITDKTETLKKDSATYQAVLSRLSEIDKQFVDITEGNKILAEKKQSATDENAKLEKEYDILRVERDELSKTVAANANRITLLEAETAAAETEIIRLSDELKESETIVANNVSNVETNNSLIESFYKEIEKLTLSAEETSGVKELKERLTETEARKQKLNDAVLQDDFKRKFHTSELSKIAEKKHEQELEITKIDTELGYISQRVGDEYGLDYESAIALRDDNYDYNVSNQEIARLRSKINSLGSINPSAMEECRILRERYEEHLAQKEDLDKAEQDLRDAIKSLTEEMLKTFNVGFEQIRNHFKRIFKELFGGGTADLILDYSEADDPLLAGVEIVAEPPGKKLQKISLLSGGEMALTAIAILFAILKLRPMPFCVLDEIEAALDDANVERFARYLKNFSQETQFVVITHKKVTMELADALFGVTMQEKGVSKIVSVKLADIKDSLNDN